MRPIPHPNESRTADGPEDDLPPIEDVVDDVLNRLRSQSRKDVESAVQYVFDTDSDLASNYKSHVIKAVNDRLPDEFEFEPIYDLEEGQGIRILSGCPDCGNEDIFNTAYRYEFTQFVAHEATEAGIDCFIDDGGKPHFERITCGLCGNVVHENKPEGTQSESDDQ